MLRVMASDWLKIRRKMIWFLIFLGPLGVVGLQGANFGLRYDYFMKRFDGQLWEEVVSNVGFLAVTTLLMGITIITSMIASIEHQSNSWKQLIALPVRKWTVFTSKFLLTACLLLVSSFVLGAGTVVLGVSLGMPLADAPWVQILHLVFYMLLAALPFLAFQLWLSITVSNQALPLTIGITSAIVSLFAAFFKDWMPWKWPYLINQWEDPLASVGMGAAAGLLLYLLGMAAFIRKEVR